MAKTPWPKLVESRPNVVAAVFTALVPQNQIIVRQSGNENYALFGCSQFDLTQRRSILHIRHVQMSFWQDGIGLNVTEEVFSELARQEHIVPHRVTAFQ